MQTLENPALIETLRIAVILHIKNLKSLGYIPKACSEAVAALPDELGAYADQLLFGGEKSVSLFNQLAMAVAVLAFAPNGIELFGMRFEAFFD